MKFPCLECSENSISQKREQVLLKIHLYCIPESGTPRTMRLGAEGTVPSPGKGGGGWIGTRGDTLPAGSPPSLIRHV